MNENDNNKNRKYKELGKWVSETFAKDSSATNKNALSDPYVKAICWASRRIETKGIVALVTNSGFLDAIAGDGMRNHLVKDFDEIYILDLGGNVRRNPKLSGTTHNVFGIQVGVSVNIFIRRTAESKKQCVIHYCRTDEFWTKQEKYRFLEGAGASANVEWKTLTPDLKGNWLTEGLRDDFESFPQLEKIFQTHSRSVVTCRDTWAYNFDSDALASNIERTVQSYCQEVARWARRTDKKARLDDFLTNDEKQVSWSETLKKHVEAGDFATFDKTKIRQALYRPFCRQYIYFDSLLNERRYQLPYIFPKADSDENQVIWWKAGSDWPFFSLASRLIPDVLPQGGSQCFPFYTYAEDGTHRRENITDWALEQFRAHYHDPSITKWDIFHYIYAVLHHPEYRERYAAKLRRELPRIPFASLSSVFSVVKDFEVFNSLATAGQRLAEIHVHYEQQPEYKLTKTEKKGEKLDYRVTKMKLSKDKTTLIYNQFLTLSGIPKETYEYRLGNRSALEWVIDQYQVSTDKRSGITNDPNREDDPQYILRLIGQVVTVSLETVKIVASFPKL